MKQEGPVRGPPPLRRERQWIQTGVPTFVTS